ncbi:MAG: lysophospholipid acyltransferase family protein [Phycisphaerales bacterium]
MVNRLRAKHPGSPLARLLFYELGRWLTLLLLIACYRHRWFGRRNVPASGAVLLVANHQAHLDPPIVGCPIFQRHLDFIARSGLFRSRVFGWMIASLNSTPIREEGGGDTRAIKDVLARLAAGRAVLIFPEGSRSPDGAIGEFKRGAAVLVKRAACPVVPVAVEGAFDAWPRTRRLPRLWGRRVMVMYGRPVSPQELLAAGPDAAVALLRAEIDAMRLELRRKLRRATDGGYPAPGAGDETV